MEEEWPHLPGERLLSDGGGDVAPISWGSPFNGGDIALLSTGSSRCLRKEASSLSCKNL